MASSPQEKWNSKTESWQSEAEHDSRFGSVVENGGEVPLDAQQLLAHELRPAPRRNFRPLVVILVGLVAFVLIYFGVSSFTGPKGPPTFQDLGAGVSNAAGLRGDLSTRWVGRAEYQLKFRALKPYEDWAFSYVVAHPQRRLSFHIRLLDSTGFALCSKDVIFPADPSRVEVIPVPFPELVPKPSGSGAAASAGEATQALSKGKDSFQEELGDNGRITAFTAQGVLPCTVSEYKQFSYWDFSSNFPTLAEQQAIAMAPIIAAERKAAAEREAQHRIYLREHPSTFYLSGDANVNYYDSTSGLIEVATGQRFRILNKSNMAIANKWANDNVQVHYKCDQHANCQLSDGSAAGTVQVKSVP